MRGISVRGVLTSHIGGNVRAPPSHRRIIPSSVGVGPVFEAEPNS